MVLATCFASVLLDAARGTTVEELGCRRRDRGSWDACLEVEGRRDRYWACRNEDLASEGWLSGDQDRRATWDGSWPGSYDRSWQDSCDHSGRDASEDRSDPHHAVGLVAAGASMDWLQGKFEVQHLAANDRGGRTKPIHVVS